MAHLDHASLAVEDLDRAVGFYTAAFGYELLFRDRQTDAIATLTGVPGMGCELAQLRNPQDGSVLELVRFEPPVGDAQAVPAFVDHGHVAFRVDDLESATADLLELGAVPLGGQVSFPTGRAIYLREPAGTVLELYEPA